jgi:ATP-binding cassette subfamily C exporter for protease/lipase/ATP-binding cassette subfamily C protein EexD
MRELLAGLRPIFFYAGMFSLAINLLFLAPSLYMLQVFDRVITSRSLETLIFLTLAAVGALAVMATLDLIRARLLVSAGVVLDRALGQRVLRESLNNAARPGGAEHGYGNRDVSILRGFLTGPGMFSLFDVPWLPIYVLLIFLFHPLLGAVALVGAILLLGFAALGEWFTRLPLDAFQRHSQSAAHCIEAGLRNADVVRGLGMAEALARRWQIHNGQAILAQAGAGRTGGSLGAMTKFARQAIQVVMLGVGAYLVIEQQVTAGVMMAATIILGRALQPVELLIAGWRSLVVARAAYARLSALVRIPPERVGTELPVPTGAVSVERVVFTAKGTEGVILKGVSFKLGAGEALGLIGPSASGKSTLARLIIGAWRPMSGGVRLDGADISLWSREAIGRHIGYLPQDVELFFGTVAENIARLKVPDDEAVVDAAKRAHAHELIMRLPRGYDTPIGEAGSALSAGQRQRVALARALYGSPRLVVLDEPNAFLDGDGEVALLNTLAGLKSSGVTTVLITHRPSLLACVDKVLVLRDGSVVVFGDRGTVIPQVVQGGATGGLGPVGGGGMPGY